MDVRRFILRILIGSLAGIVISFTLAEKFFDLSSREAIDQWFLVLVPAGAVFACLWFLFPYLEKTFVEASGLVRGILLFWAAVVSLLPLFVLRYDFSPALFLFVIAFLLTLPAAPSLQILLDAGGSRRAVGAWLFAFAFSFFLISFLDDFYSSPGELILLTLAMQVIFSIGGYFLMGRVKRVAGERLFDAFIHGALFLMLTGFILWLFNANQRVTLFPLEHFVLNIGSRWIFLFVSLLSLPWQAWLHIQLKFSGFYNRVKHTKVYAYVSANLAGLSLALLFLVLYLLFASVINIPYFDVDDIYFDADGLIWRLRLTTDTWQDFYWRSVHPFVILLLRPPVSLLAFLLKGDTLWSAYLFVAMGGASCVYLVWMFIKTASGNSVYASLMAALLGLSASHLIFGSLIETYIFLAASLLIFYLLLLNDRPLPALVTASLMTVGITHSNFVQNVIALFAVKPNIKQIIRFTATVLVLLVLLTVLNNLLFPDSHPFFFVPSTLQAEQQNLFPLNSLRIHAMIRAFFFHNIAAPTPILHTGEIPFIQFRFFKPEIYALSQYDLPIQIVTSWYWLVLLLFAGLLALLTFKKYPYSRFSLALVGCLTLNGILHLRYGKELFLYTPNWTYALVLLLGLSWLSVSHRRWFQVVLLIFLSLLMVNNGTLLLTILDVLASQL